MQTLAVLILLYLVGVPLVMNIGTAFCAPDDYLPLEPGATCGLHNLIAVYGNGTFYLSVLSDTALFALGSLLVAFIGGFPLAFLVERTDLPFKTFTYATALVPLMIPTIVLVLGWIFLLGETNGLFNVLIRKIADVKGAGPMDVFTLYGMMLIQGSSMVPLVFLFSSGAMRNMSPALEEASSASGAHYLTTIRRVTLPLLRPHLLSLTILMLIFSISTYEVPVLVGVGARRHVFSTEIYFALTPAIGAPKYGEAATLALTFLLVAYVLFIEYQRQVRNVSRFVTVTGKGFRPRFLELGRWKYPALAFVFLLAMVQIICPLLVLVSGSMMSRFAVPFIQADPRDMTLRFFAKVLTDPRFLLAIANTIIVATTSALVVSVLSATIAWIVVRKNFRGRRLLDLVASSSVTTPGVVVGVSFLIFYLMVAPVFPVYGTIWMLILVYSYRVSVGYRVNLAAITQVSRELEEAAETSGAPWFTTFRTILLPLIMPSLVVTFLVAINVSFGDTTLPLSLGVESVPVITLLIWENIQIGQLSVAAAMSVVSVAIMLAVGFIARRFVTFYVNP